MRSAARVLCDKSETGAVRRNRNVGAHGRAERSAGTKFHFESHERASRRATGAPRPPCRNKRGYGENYGRYSPAELAPTLPSAAHSVILARLKDWYITALGK